MRRVRHKTHLTVAVTHCNLHWHQGTYCAYLWAVEWLWKKGHLMLWERKCAGWLTLCFWRQIFREWKILISLYRPVFCIYHASLLINFTGNCIWSRTIMCSAVIINYVYIYLQTIAFRPILLHVLQTVLSTANIQIWWQNQTKCDMCDMCANSRH